MHYIGRDSEMPQNLKLNWTRYWFSASHNSIIRTSNYWIEMCNLARALASEIRELKYEICHRKFDIGNWLPTRNTSIANVSPRVRTYERNQTIPWLSPPNLRSTSNLARALLPPTPRPPICIEPSKSLKSCIPNVLHKNQLTRGLARSLAKGLASFWKSR